MLYFPFTYLIADILTEVYGYARARSILWLSLLCSMIAAAVVQAALMVPAAAFFKDDAAFHLVFSTAPKIAVAGFLAMFSGDICTSRSRQDEGLDKREATLAPLYRFHCGG